MLIILALGKRKQAGQEFILGYKEFEASLSSMRYCLKTKYNKTSLKCQVLLKSRTLGWGTLLFPIELSTA